MDANSSFFPALRQRLPVPNELLDAILFPLLIEGLNDLCIPHTDGPGIHKPAWNVIAVLPHVCRSFRLASLQIFSSVFSIEPDERGVISLQDTLLSLKHIIRICSSRRSFELDDSVFEDMMDKAYFFGADGDLDAPMGLLGVYWHLAQANIIFHGLVKRSIPMRFEEISALGFAQASVQTIREANLYKGISRRNTLLPLLWPIINIQVTDSLRLFLNYMNKALIDFMAAGPPITRDDLWAVQYISGVFEEMIEDLSRELSCALAKDFKIAECFQKLLSTDWDPHTVAELGDRLQFWASFVEEDGASGTNG
ncbi:hypothetical protein K439DRAFT_1622544 [Ramaria rubella]|nr:hypothetical protein K439DRAFT_1622544 [Ramaria rubella]